MGARRRLAGAAPARLQSALLALSALVLSARGDVARAEPVAPDAGVFRGAPDADEPPEEVFERLEKRMSRYCKGLGATELRDFYRVSFQAHQFFQQRIELEPRKKLYASYLEKLCGRFSSKHEGIGAAFPYPEIELFLVDVSTELCDLETRRPAARVEAALGGKQASRRLDIARQFCKRAAPYLETPDAVRAAFAAAIMDELCLDPTRVRNDAYPPLTEARRTEAVAVCEQRASAAIDDTATVTKLWSPTAPAPRAPEPSTHPWLIALAALTGVLGAGVLAYKLKGRS